MTKTRTGPRPVARLKPEVHPRSVARSKLMMCEENNKNNSSNYKTLWPLVGNKNTYNAPLESLFTFIKC